MRPWVRPLFFIIIGGLLALAVFAGVIFGTTDIPALAVLKIILSKLPLLGQVDDSGEPTWRTIVLQIRLPVVLMALFVGAGLGASGAAMQGLFRNPLVDPFIIGISSGGAFGAILGNIAASKMGLGLDVTRLLIISLSFVFAIGAVLLAYAISRTGSKISIANMLLAGIAISAFLTALTQMLTYFFIDNPKAVIFSLMGSCSNSSWSEVGFVAPVVLLCAGVLVFFGRDLNAFSAGEETAKHLGVDVEGSKVLILCLGSLATAIAIPFCGIIAFVGLIIPHVVRSMIGPDHRLLVPGSLLCGGFFLVLCDMFSRNAMYWFFDSYVQIPVGIVTALVGGLFFVYLLATRRRTG